MAEGVGQNQKDTGTHGNQNRAGGYMIVCA
jgi:hypothetical protein